MLLLTQVAFSYFSHSKSLKTIFLQSVIVLYSMPDCIGFIQVIL